MYIYGIEQFDRVVRVNDGNWNVDDLNVPDYVIVKHRQIRTSYTTSSPSEMIYREMHQTVKSISQRIVLITERGKETLTDYYPRYR